MKKSFIVCMMCAALVGFVCLPYVQALDAPAADTEMKAPAGATATQAPVMFPHKKHAAVQCLDCHHKDDMKAAPKKCSAAGCHDNADPTDKTSEKSYYKAFHDMKSPKSCLGCHKVNKDAGKPTGPTVCNQCHPKKQG